MKKIRIGNDISVKWTLIFKDTQEPFYIQGSDIRLYLKNKYGKEEVSGFTVTDNVISWTFFGRDQKFLGEYSLTLVLNEDIAGMLTHDACRFVELVNCSCKEDGGDSCGVSTETIEIESLVDVASSGGTITIVIDSELSTTSTNPVENRVITSALESKADKSELDAYQPKGDYLTEVPSDVLESIANKVDKVSGKGLSSNDFTDAYKGALDGLDDALASKQDVLVSGENVKTINGETILGGGDIITDLTILDFALLGEPLLRNYYSTGQVLAATGLDDYDLFYSSLTERPLVIKKDDSLVYPCSVRVSGTNTWVYYKLLNYNSVNILDLSLLFSKTEWTLDGSISYRLIIDNTELNLATQGELDAKQDTLVSGTNIKTIGGQSILGTGDIPFNFSNYYTKQEIDDKGYSITISTTGTEQGGYKLTREIVSRAYDSGDSLYFKVSNNDGSIKIVQLNVERTLDSVEGAYIYYVWGWLDEETIIEWTFGNTIEDAGVYGTYVEGFNDSSYYGYPSKGNLLIEESDNASYNAKVTLFGGTKNAVTTYANIASDNKSISLIGGSAGNMGTLSATTLTISDGVVSGKIPMSYPTINDYIATSDGGGSITIIPIEEANGTHRSVVPEIDLSAYATKDELTNAIAEAITNTLNTEV